LLVYDHITDVRLLVFGVAHLGLAFGHMARDLRWRIGLKHGAGMHWLRIRLLDLLLLHELGVGTQDVDLLPLLAARDLLRVLLE
jgi:hypothetical protein